MPEPNLLPSSHRLLPASLLTAPVAALRHGLSMRPGLATLNNHSRSLGLDTSVGESESEGAQGCSAGSADLLAKAETFTTSVRLRLQAPFHPKPRWFEITPRKNESLRVSCNLKTPFLWLSGVRTRSPQISSE